MTEDVTIDAEYMNRWLGNTKITSLSPKTLYDVQTLIEYYRDIIVPGVELEIDFPVEGKVSGPCASVKDGKVYIPFAMLQRGEVDSTIGAMIHELHHIKLSPSEETFNYYAFCFMQKVMKSLKIDDLSIYDRVFNDDAVTYESIKSDTEGSKDVQFVRTILRDMLLLMNAVEDVRIDENTPSNLKKYIDKSDLQCAPKLKSAYEKGDLNDSSLHSLCYKLLGHHKQMFVDEEIAEKFGDKEFIVNSTGQDLQIALFEAFSKEIAAYIYSKYLSFNPSVFSKDSDFDKYFSEQTSELSDNSIEQQFAFSSWDTTDPDSAQYVDPSTTRDTASKIDKISVAQDDLPSEVTLVASQSNASEQLHKDLLELTEGAKLSIAEYNQIKAFKNIQVHTFTETFNNDKRVTFDVVIYDSVL